MSEENKSEWVPPSVEECVAMLKSGPKGVEKWNAMREEHPEWKPDLSGQNFFEVNLNGVNLSEADLIEANFSRANLSAADLTSANLFLANCYEANFWDVCLIEAHLNRANFADADLSATNFSKASMIGTVLSSANLSDADFTGANTTGVNWWCAIIVDTKGMRRADVKICLATHEASIEFAD